MIGSSGALVNLNEAGSTTGYILGKSTSSAGWNGTFYVSTAYFQSGVLYQGSDERWKNFRGEIKADFDKINEIPKMYYEWKEELGLGTNMQIGTSAQKLLELYPEIVSLDDKGYLSVAYDRLSIIALAAVDELHREILELKKSISK